MLLSFRLLASLRRCFSAEFTTVYLHLFIGTNMIISSFLHVFFFVWKNFSTIDPFNLLVFLFMYCCFLPMRNNVLHVMCEVVTCVPPRVSFWTRRYSSYRLDEPLIILEFWISFRRRSASLMWRVGWLVFWGSDGKQHGFLSWPCALFFASNFASKSGFWCSRCWCNSFARL